jgi:hypothetical protein
VASDSFEAVLCAFQRPLNPPVCSDQRVPPQIVAQFGAARALVETAGDGAACSAGRRGAYGRAGFRVRKALKQLDRTQRRRARLRLSPDCFSVLRSVLLDARHRVQSSIGSCTPER